MSEDFGNNYVVLTDEDGNEVEFEHIDTVEVDGETYMAFIPAELAVDEEADVDGELVILKVVEEDGEEVLVSVEDDDEADRVFDIVMERVEDMYEDDDEPEADGE